VHIGRRTKVGFSQIESWGYVEPGTQVCDSKGNRYVVTKQNDQGFLALKNCSGGESMAFEVLDPIDHEEFQEAD
jgi:hypothetical protein